MTTFVLKDNEKDVQPLDANRMLASRSEQITRSSACFRARPWAGIGFCIPGSFFRRDGNACQRSNREGICPTAVLEEVGIIGTGFFILFLVAFLLWLRQEHNLPGLILLIVFLVVNMGEVMFFSFGGHGALGWVMVMAAGILGPSCTLAARSEPDAFGVTPGQKLTSSISN